MTIAVRPSAIARAHQPTSRPVFRAEAIARNIPAVEERRLSRRLTSRRTAFGRRKVG
jgi:hypothetical protein